MMVPVSLITVLVCLVVLSLILLSLAFRLAKIKKLMAFTQNKLNNETETHQSLVTELSALKEKCVHGLLYDALTGLPGRKVFEDRLSQIFLQSKRYQLNFAVMFIYLDNLKEINAAKGFEVGDELIKETSNRLQHSIRQVDTVSRFSNDEFVIIASQLNKPETAAYVARRILDSISQPYKINEEDLFLTASIGIATFPTDGSEALIILKNAHNALHQAKNHGNSYQFYRPELHALSQRELVVATSLQNSKIYSEFNILYQPQIDTEKKKINCLHALLFWDHPDLGRLALDDFMRQAENNGKIIEIGDWMIRQVMQQFMKWQRSNPDLTAISVSISPRQLENPHFAYKLSQFFQEVSLDPSSLILEISETALVSKLDVIEKVFHMLKHLGVRLTIKEFGIGQLSLQHLKSFPIDSLKISSSIIQDITLQHENEVVIKMAIAIAKSLQISISADGVETEKQAQLLNKLGCHNLQGSFIKKPLPANELSFDKV